MGNSTEALINEDGTFYAFFKNLDDAIRYQDTIWEKDKKVLFIANEIKFEQLINFTNHLLKEMRNK